jgi:Zn-dependent M28 family amino/carboxypeptidase
MKIRTLFIIQTILILSLLFASCAPAAPSFDENRAFQDAQTQLSFGVRYPGSIGHAKTQDWIVAELEKNNWQVQLFEYPYFDMTITNIVAHRDGTAPHILFGAHYDTRLLADQDPNDPQEPVLGANDGASGVAVLIELARVIPENIPNEITLAFFDFEDQGGIGQYQWIAGSTALAGDSEFNLPDQVIIVDMIGDKDLNVYMDRNSDPALTAEVWQAAQKLGYEGYIIPEGKYSMLDDHVPFKNQNIPAIDMIDFDYPAWHTTTDDESNISAKSLGIIGKTLLYWLSKSNP